MEQGLIKAVKELMPKIKDPNSSYNEQELSPLKAMYEAINNTRIYSMMSCGGKLCEDIRRGVINYMANLEHITFEEPKKVEVSKQPTRNELMLEALSIASKKNIKKPHPKMGVKKLKDWINENK